MSTSNQFTLAIRTSETQNGKRQREDSDDEPRAKRVRYDDDSNNVSVIVDDNMDINEVHDSHNTKGNFDDDKEGSGSQERDDDGGDDDDNDDDDESDSDESEDCIIKILIGTDEQEFFVSNNTICRQSGYFNDVISTDYSQDDKEIVVRLPGMLPKPFRTYLHWVEHREVIPELWPGCAEEDLTEEMELQAWMFMYVLADEHFFDPELKTYTMEFLIAEHAGWSAVPGGEFATHFWRQTDEGSHLRTFMVEWIFHRYAGFTKYARFARDALAYPEEFQEQFAELAATRGLPPNGTVPDEKSDQAFRDAMREKLLECDESDDVDTDIE